jgi:hypothetical protein
MFCALQDIIKLGPSINDDSTMLNVMLSGCFIHETAIAALKMSIMSSDLADLVQRLVREIA